MINAIANFSGFLAPLLVGELLDRHFTNAQLVPYVACCPLVAAVLIAALRFPVGMTSRSEENRTRIDADDSPLT